MVESGAEIVSHAACLHANFRMLISKTDACWEGIGAMQHIQSDFIDHARNLQDTLIVWSEGDNFDLALSFQEKAGCDEIWEKICQVQGKDPSVDITQDIVEESEDERFDDMSDSAPPVELPPCELSRLEEINEVSIKTWYVSEFFEPVPQLLRLPNAEGTLIL